MKISEIGCHCPVCDSILGITIELIEFLLEFQTEKPIGNDGVPQSLSPFVIIPIGINPETKELIIVGWCEKCKKPMASSISIDELRDMFNEAG